MTYALLLALSLAALPATQASTASTSVDRFRQDIETTALLDDATRGNVIRDWFMKDLSRLDPRSMDGQELRNFFLASLNAASLARDRRISVTARAVFDELDARSMLTESDYVYMHGLYIRLRDFGEAGRFREAHGSRSTLEEIPAIAMAKGLDATQPSRFVPLDDGTMRLENVILGEQDFVLVVADPLCHFTLDALAAIESDHALREYFSAHSKWLVPDGLSLDLAAVRKWNLAFPQYRLSLVDDVRDWRDVTHWDTPTFYFFENGSVARVVRGWPPEGHVTELRAIIDKDTP